MMALYFQVPLFKGILCRHKLLYLFHPCWRVIIVDIRIVPRKALGAEQFFVIKRSVWFAELCVPLVGYFPQTMIRWHIFLLCRDTINRVHPPESLSEADAINRVPTHYTIRFRKTPMPSISNSMTSSRWNQGCTPVPISSRHPVPTVPEPRTSPTRRRALRVAQAII